MKNLHLNVFIAGINRTALREIKLLQELKHPNIIGVRIKDPSVYSTCTSDRGFETQNQFISCLKIMHYVS